MESHVLGIDVGKSRCHAALLLAGKIKNKAFDNSPAGVQELQSWLKRQQVEKGHACMEATGTYAETLATWLIEAGHDVSIVNPARIKGFAQSELSRTKTDKTDAGVIARFCLAHKPAKWQAPLPEVRALRDWVRRLEDLKEMFQMEDNRLKSGVLSQEVEQDIRQLMSQLEEAMRLTRKRISQHLRQHPKLREDAALLGTIPGIAEQTAALILAEIGSAEAFQSAKHLAAYAGLTPREKQSGTSVRGKARLSKVGNAHLRRGLFMPARTALRCNPAVQALGERLKQKGLPNKAIQGAAMRKLLHMAYGVLKSRRPFDPSLAAG